MSLRFIIALLIIVIVSSFLTFHSPVNEVFRGVIALPAVGALFAALFQLFRDEAAHQKKTFLQEEQQFFNLGAMSHMSNSVFDRHIEFCEKYMKEVHEVLFTFTREGPTGKALDHANNLYLLRTEYAAWITPKIESKLFPFEKAVREIGANIGLSSALSKDETRAAVRNDAIEKIYDTFKNLMSIGEQSEVNEESTILAVKERVRDILQISELTNIREFLIKSAATKLSQQDAANSAAAYCVRRN